MSLQAFALRLKPYIVYGPLRTRWYTGWNLPEGGAPEEGRDVVEVFAPNKRAAKVLASRAPEMRELVREARGDDRNPFSDMTAELLACEHDVWLGGCAACEQQTQQEADAARYFLATAGLDIARVMRRGT